MRTFNTESFGLTVDAFTRGALGIHALVERTVTIQEDAHATTQFPAEIFDTSFKEISALRYSCVTGTILV